MSVLIKGMWMPKHCWQCRFKDSDDLCVLLDDDCMKIWGEQNRLPECPLIELPTHGDLIDRDVVVARLAEWSKRLIETYGENDEYVNCLSEVLEGLGCDDVVIPAERGEE